MARCTYGGPVARNSYNKPYLTIDEQIARIVERGLAVPDTEHAADLLRKVGYYRLSGYWHLFRELPPEPVPTTSDAGPEVLADEQAKSPESSPLKGLERRLSTFVAGASLPDVERIYEFDRELRMLVFDALEIVEVALRARIGYLVGQGHAFAHRDPRHLHSDFTGQGTATPGMEYSSWLDSNHAEWLREVDREEKRSSETFVLHFREKYGPPLPIWAATEIMSFGTLTRLFSGMDRAHQNRVAAALGVFGERDQGEGSTLANWLNHMRYIRNTCAHHARLWNRNMAVQLAEPTGVEDLAHLDERCRSRIYATLAVLAFLLARLAPTNDWRSRATDFLQQAPQRIGQPLSAMGFLEAWRDEAIWSDTYSPSDPEWEARQDLLDRLPSVTAGELGRILRPEAEPKKQRDWIRYLRSRDLLLGIRQDSSTYLYPLFQIDAETGAVHAAIGLANKRLMQSLVHEDPDDLQWAAARWWLTPHPRLAASPLSLVDEGSLTDEIVDQLLGADQLSTHSD